MNSSRDQNYASDQNLLSDWKTRADVANTLDDSQESTEKLQEILKAASRARLESSSIVLDIHESLADVLFRRKLYNWASRECAKAWNKRVERSADSDFDTIKERTTRLNLVKYLTAEKLYDRALDVALAGSDDLLHSSINPVKISALEPLAEELLRGHRYENALELYKIILHHESTSHDKRHPSTIDPRFGVATALHGLRMFKEARFNATYNSHLLENSGDKDKSRLERHSQLIQQCTRPELNGQEKHLPRSTTNSSTVSNMSPDVVEKSKSLLVGDVAAGAEREKPLLTPKRSWAAVAGDAKALPSPTGITKIPSVSVKTVVNHRRQRSVSNQGQQSTHLRVPQAGSFGQPQSRPDRGRATGQTKALSDRNLARAQPSATTSNSRSPSSRSARVPSGTFSTTPSRTLGPSNVQRNTDAAYIMSSQRPRVSDAATAGFSVSKESTLADSIEWPKTLTSPYNKDFPELETGEANHQNEDEKRQFNALLLRDLEPPGATLPHHTAYNALPHRSMDVDDTKSDINPLGNCGPSREDDELSTISLPPGNIGDRAIDSLNKIILQTLNLATVAKSKGTSLLSDFNTKNDLKATSIPSKSPVRPQILTPASDNAVFLSTSHGNAGTVSALPQSPASQMGDDDHGTWLDAEEFENDPKISKSADIWMLDTRKKAHDLVGQAAHTNKKPVKICVLDTGFDGKHPFLTDAPWGEKDAGSRIKGCIWFDEEGILHSEKKSPSAPLANDCPGYQDSHGHGTHCAGLLLQLAPFAHIYIAKVIGGPKGTPVADYVAKAIKHAVDEESGWGVDILSISLGFEGEEPPNVDNVISNLRPRVLLFAAAANTAARNPNIAFPASIGKAICIKSADGNGSPSHRNPKNTVDAGKNFTALGQGVLSMTPMKDEWNGLRVLQKRMSGTSVATPVAAACAALVLEFIRQKDDARSTKLVEIRKAMRENMKDNIERIFLDLMTEKDGDYHFLVPHKLLKRHPDLGGKERDEVAHAIYTCLKTH
ncbi:hypothetical protein EG328_005540 [Venturia inaequalis]|uniref:Peptidase S8/S53 domain-containing protein n=1 Tax=Venturia inaequalis TaxID=5025 RepID=A0A8H3UJM2_VENIN|nr:hypothetical protein EG328_005540 [Venturia inaequalis]